MLNQPSGSDSSRLSLGLGAWFALGLSLFFLLADAAPILGSRGGLFYGLENKAQDSLFEWNKARLRTADPRIVIAAIDDKTGQEFGFPLPRGEYGILLDKLRAAGAKLVAFDVMFFDPADARQTQILAAGAKRFKNTVFAFTATPDGLTQYPVPSIRKAARLLGNVSVNAGVDPDGHIRWAVLAQPTGDPQMPVAPSLSLAAYAGYTGQSLGGLEQEYAGVRPINFRPPLSQFPENGQWPIYHRISIADILAGRLGPRDRARLKGALVLVGSTTLGYYDHSPSPFLTAMPGVELNANVIDNLLHHDFLRPWPGWALALAILAMIWIPFLLMRLPPWISFPITGVSALAWLAVAEKSFLNGERVQVIAPLLALAASFALQAAYRFWMESREKRFIKGLFGQFVAPEVVEDLARHPGKVRLGGEKREMTILFLDIAHFTVLSEKMAPEALIEFLNTYLSKLSGAIYEWRAVVGNYIGDCIMAFWNAPVLPDSEHRAKACLAALKCRSVLEELNKDFQSRGVTERPDIRIGINSGVVTVGLTGSDRKLQYTALGDEVNLASRLEGANKFFGSGILASGAVYQGAKDSVEARELGRVRVVGKEAPVLVYEILAEKGKLSPERSAALADYEEGLAAFKARRWQEAASAFGRAVEKFPSDGPAKLYQSLSRDYSVVPPLEGWDGVFNLTAK